MRPLIVLTGQGVPRADGFNLTRRMKATPRLAALTEHVRRKDRQNLDALLEACAAAGEDSLHDVLHDLRAICLKERRSTLRKIAHHGVFAALADSATQRLVVHLTTNVDGLTTTFAVRDFGACWPPFRAPSSAAAIVDEVQRVLDRGSGLLHFPVHGEAGLVLSEAPGEILQTFYGAPRSLPGNDAWQPSLRLGIAAGVAGLEQRLLPARLGYALFDALLTPGTPSHQGLVVPQQPAADLVVVGYGAEDSVTRSAYPFEQRIARLASSGRDPATRSTALVYRPEENAPSAQWFEENGFTVVPYDDGEIAHVLRRVLTRALPGVRHTSEDGAAEPVRQGMPQP